MIAVGSSGARNRALFERLARQQLTIERGGTERVAGVQGRIYRLSLTGGGAAPHTFELVISTESRLAPAGREILRFYDQLRAPILAVAGTEPQPYTAVRGLLASGTPLRVGPHYRLREVETRRVPASSFALPGPVLTRERFLDYLQRAGMFADSGDVPPDDGSVNGTVLPDEDPGNDVYAGNELYAANELDAENEAAPE